LSVNGGTGGSLVTEKEGLKTGGVGEVNSSETKTFWGWKGGEIGEKICFLDGGEKSGEKARGGCWHFKKGSLGRQKKGPPHK